MCKKLMISGVIAVMATVAVLVSAALVGAQSGSGAISNWTPGVTKLHYTGGTVPSPGWTTIGRVTLPAGSWAVFAKTNLSAMGPATSVECWLLAPDGHPDLAIASLTGAAQKYDSIRNLSFQTVTNAPNGGVATVVCRLMAKHANGTVFARGTVLTAVSDSGVTATANR